MIFRNKNSVPTQKRVAELAGVSQEAVSQILNTASGKKYSQATQEKVKRIAKEIGYVPNRASRSLRKGRSNLIGIVHFGNGLETASKVAMCLPRIVNEHGYDYLVLDLRWCGGNMERIIHEVIQARVEGIIITHMSEGFGPEYTELLAKHDIPVVSLFGSEKLNVPVVRADVKPAFADLTRSLLLSGRRRLLHIAGGSYDWPITRRIEGFRDGMQGIGACEQLMESEFFKSWPALLEKHENEPLGVILRIENERHGHNFLMAAYEICQRLFANGYMPDAIVSANDQGAFGVFNAAYTHQIRVPQELAVTGCDDDQFGALPMFNLTTVRIDVESACREVMDVLVQIIRTGRKSEKNRFCPVEIVFRASCGRNFPSETLILNQPHP